MAQYLSLFSVLMEPAELLLPRIVGVVMVTCRQLKKGIADRRFWTFWAQHRTPDATVNTPARVWFSGEAPPALICEPGTGSGIAYF